ncbi:hypothetical protein ACAL30_001627 [Campylobacter jejuni]
MKKLRKIEKRNKLLLTALHSIMPKDIKGIKQTKCNLTAGTNEKRA